MKTAKPTTESTEDTEANFIFTTVPSVMAPAFSFFAFFFAFFFALSSATSAIHFPSR